MNSIFKRSSFNSFKVGISMKSVNDISIAEINSGFQKINQMGGGGDGLEDQEGSEFLEKIILYKRLFVD